MTNAKQQPNKTSEDKLHKFLGYFNDSWNYAKNNYHATWERNWKLYNNKRIKRNHPGVIETFVPMVNSTVNTIVAALFNSNPSVRYIPDHKDQEADTKVLNEIYQDFARRDGWVRKNKVNGRQGVITGNFCAYYEWINDKDAGYVHKVIVPVRDMIIDPQATDRESWRFIGRRFFASKKSLAQETIFDFTSQKEVKRYKNLDNITSSGKNTEDESDKTKKDQAIGSIASSNKDDSVELIEIWTKKEVVVIANRTTIIEEKENPHYAVEKAHYEQRKAEWNLNRAIKLSETGEDMGEFPEVFNDDNAGLLPFAHGCEYEDISLVYGSSDVDIIADEQELLNILTELNIEAMLYTLFPERTIDPKYIDEIDNLNPAPGKVYPLISGAMSWNTPPVIPNNVLNERTNIKDEIRESASVSQVSKGVTATDSLTATEIKATLGQADIRIQEKAQNLADGFFLDEANIVLKLLQLYAPRTMWVRTANDVGTNFEEVDMDKFLGSYTPMVTLDVMKKMADQEEKETYMQAYQMLIADPTNNLPKIKEHLLPKILPMLSKEELQEITTPAQNSNLQANQQLVEPAIHEEVPAENSLVLNQGEYHE